MRIGSVTREFFERKLFSFRDYFNATDGNIRVPYVIRHALLSLRLFQALRVSTACLLTIHRLCCLSSSSARYITRQKCTYLSLLLLATGTVHPNPGPTYRPTQNDVPSYVLSANSTLTDYLGLLHPNDIQIIPTPADGHCLFHAISLSFLYQHGVNISTEAIIKRVRNELLNNYDAYMPFGYTNFSLFLRQIERYLEHKIFDSTIGDMAPLAVANALEIQINILDKITASIHMHARIEHLQSSVKPGVGLLVYWHSDHYSGITLSLTAQRVLSPLAQPFDNIITGRPISPSSCLTTSNSPVHHLLSLSPSPTMKPSCTSSHATSVVPSTTASKYSASAVSASQSNLTFSGVETAADDASPWFFIANGHFTIVHLNIQGLLGQTYKINNRPLDTHSKIDFLKYSAQFNNSPAIICLTETKLGKTIDDNEVNLNGYTLYRRDRDRRRGGVAIYARSDIKSAALLDLSPSVEHCAIRVTLSKGDTYIICCVYRPPSARTEWHDQFHDLIDRLLLFNFH